METQKERVNIMKKLIVVVLCLTSIMICLSVEIYADEDDYASYNEVMMADGKLLDNFTEEELEYYYSQVQKRMFWGTRVAVANHNVETTYISSTLYSVDNQGDTNVDYELNIVVETATKVTWKVSGSLSGTAKSTLKSFKGDLAAKVGVEYNSQTTESRKETQKMKVTVEKGSRAIVYLMGSARVTNGVCACYIMLVRTVTCGFEYFMLVNQYPRLEKRSL